MSRPAPARSRRSLRCAIYTRKSSEEGLEQEFNSLHAQREACEAFIRSQRHEGWTVLPQHYDDGGYSGGTMDRPALQQLLADIQAGKVDLLVTYKIDRLTRSLADFAKIVEIFDAKGVSFVSVTQQFNTTTSMGRLTLNVLLSFAQFERELAGERVRDKIAASKKKGLWMGGVPPLGYEVRDRKLVVVDSEAETVRHIFRRRARLGATPEGGARGGGCPQQAVDERRGPQLGQQAARPRRPLSDAAEPDLPRRDHPQGAILSRGARSDCRPGTVGSGSGEIRVQCRRAQHR